MNQLKKQIADLPPIMVDNRCYLSYQAVTNAVAAYLFQAGSPAHSPNQIDEAGYKRILEVADTLCRELGYPHIEKLTPPDVSLSDMGYILATPHRIARMRKKKSSWPALGAWKNCKTAVCWMSASLN